MTGPHKGHSFPFNSRGFRLSFTNKMKGSNIVLCRVVSWRVSAYYRGVLAGVIETIVPKEIYRRRHSWADLWNFKTHLSLQWVGKWFAPIQPQLYITEKKSLLHCPPGVKVTWWMTGQSDRLSNAARHCCPSDNAGGRIFSQPGQEDIKIKTSGYGV